MVESVTTAEQLARAIFCDEELSQILQETGTTLRHRVVPLAPHGSDQWEISLTLGTSICVPTISTLGLLEASIRRITSETAGPNSQVRVRVHVDCIA